MGHEAGFTNTLVLNGQSPGPDHSHSTAGQPDTFTSIAGATYLSTVNAVAGSFIDFGFCTDGGNDTGSWDRCAWDDSGAANDDNHDDYIAIARFRPVSVPEPGTTLLLGLGLLGAGMARRLRARQN